MTCPFMLDSLNLMSAWSTICGPKMRARKDLTLSTRSRRRRERQREKNKGLVKLHPKRRFSVKV